MKQQRKSYLKKVVSIVAIVVVFMPTIWCAFSVGKVLITSNPFSLWRSKQNQLASELGISINDYPYPRYFPLGYYETRLGSGTGIAEVHKTIVGYNKVFNCEYKEVYYYFSSDDHYALRFEVWYNDDLIVEKINGEDEDSRTIFIDGCTEGHMAE